MTRPTIFIGSSTKGLEVAKAVRTYFKNLADVIIWNEGVFGFSEGTLEALVAKLEDFDFAILVATLDDCLIKDGVLYPVPRDNVLFELGLFIGHLGRKRVFLLSPNSEAAHLPSDLLGVKVAHYETLDPGRSLEDATRTACVSIQNAMHSLGRLPIKASDLLGIYKYRCSASNNNEFTHGGVCSLECNVESKNLDIIGRRLWRVQSEKDDTVSEKSDKILLCQRLTPFSSWRSIWSSIHGKEYRYVYRITIDDIILNGFAHNYINFDEAKNVTGFTGDYFILPPGRREWGTMEWRRIDKTQPSLDTLTDMDILWDAMKLV
jgi:hypothetical protein